MNLLIVRHGDALQSKGHDEDRILSAAGREQCRNLGARLRLSGLMPQRVWSSPLVRAVQTAEIVCATSGFHGVVETERAFVPDGDLERAISLISTSEFVAVFSHEPFVRQLASRLLGRASHAPFRTAEALHVVDGSVAATFVV